MSNKSRPSRIPDDIRAQLFAAIGREDDGRVAFAIAILIAKYESVRPTADPAGFKAITEPAFEPPQDSAIGDFDDEFS